MEGRDVALNFTRFFDNEQFSDRSIDIIVSATTSSTSDENNSTQDAQDSAQGKAQKPSKRRRKEKSTEQVDILADTEQQLYKSVRVISALLAAQSVFFEALFSNGMRESSKGSTARLVCETPEEAEYTYKLLKFMYYNSIEDVSESNVAAWWHLAEVAHKYQVQGCFDACDAAIVGEMQAGASSGEQLRMCQIVMKDCQKMCLPKTLACCRDILQNHFMYLDEIWHTEDLRREFLDLDTAALQVLVDSDKVVVYNEQTVWRLVERWCVHRGITSGEHLDEDTRNLLQSLRYIHMTDLFLSDVVSTSPLMSCPCLLRLIIKVITCLKNATYRRNLRNAVANDLIFKQRQRTKPDWTDRWATVALSTPRSFPLVGDVITHNFEFNISNLASEEYTHPTQLLIQGHLMSFGVERVAPPSPAPEEATSSGDAIIIDGAKEQQPCAFCFRLASPTNACRFEAQCCVVVWKHGAGEAWEGRHDGDSQWVEWGHMNHATKRTYTCDMDGMSWTELLEGQHPFAKDGKLHVTVFVLVSDGESANPQIVRGRGLRMPMAVDRVPMERDRVRGLIVAHARELPARLPPRLAPENGLFPRGERALRRRVVQFMQQ